MKLNKKGFTLVELLVAIAIIGLILGFSVFGIMKVINNSEEKVTIITEKSIKNAANIYSSEADSSSWKKNVDYDAFCVTIGELMNKGFLEKNSIIENKKIGKDTYVIVKRNNITLSTISEEIVTDIINNEYNRICTGQQSNGENYNKPTINNSTNYTNMIKIPFNTGTADSGVKNYKCLYGESSSNVNKEGQIEDNNCIINNLKNNRDYYVLIYMNTSGGSSILAEGNRNYKTSDFNKTTFSQNKNEITINYNNKDTNGNNVNNPSYYFNSNVEGTTSTNLETCVLENNKYTCEGMTREIRKNTWYKVQNPSVKITYPEENNEVSIDTRIYDGSNNYRSDNERFTIKKYTVKFHRNNALNIDGNTSSYVEKYCIASGNNKCSITSPTITSQIGYSAVGWNTSATATNSSWNTNTSKEINSNLNYYAISRINVVTISYNPNTGTVRNSTTTETGNVNSWSTNNGIVYINGSILSQKINHGNRISGDGLVNYNNSRYLYISKTGYEAISGAEWICLSGCTINRKTFNQTDSYSASEFCDTSYNDCTVKLGVNWTTITYTISYNLNGGSLNTSNPTTYTVESNAITLNNPTRTGYTFAGWTGSNGNTPSTSLTIPKGSTGNKSYTANWTANSYTYNIVYKSSSGIVLGNDTITKNYDTTNTVNPKSFAGYTSPSSQSIKWDSTSSKTITFTYTPITYNISYNLNGGNLSTSNPTSYSVESNAITLNNPTRTGYTFAGWTGSNGNTPSTSLTIPKGSTGNKSYTANWNINVHYFDVNPDGGISSFTITDSSTTQSSVGDYWKQQPYGTTFTISNIVAKAGYYYTGNTLTGNGWYLSGYGSSSTTIKVQMGDGTAAIALNSRPTNYSITYNLNGGSLSTANPTTYTVESNSFTLNNPTKSGHTFTGWTGSNGSTPSTSVTISKGSTGNKSYTANWKVNNYTITYDANGGTGAPSSQTASIGSTITLSNTIPTYSANVSNKPYNVTYKQFTGWNTNKDGTGTSYSSGASYTGNTSVTLYAQWHEHSWNAIGTTIFPADGLFTCGYVHTIGYNIYCSGCGMSANYYNTYVVGEKDGNVATKSCPCNPISSVKYFSESSDIGNSTSNVTAWGGIYNGGKMLPLSVYNPERYCDEHKPNISVSSTLEDGSSYNGDWTNKTINTTIRYSTKDSKNPALDLGTLQYYHNNSWYYIDKSGNIGALGYTKKWAYPEYSNINETVTFKICDVEGNCSSTSTTLKKDNIKPGCSLNQIGTTSSPRLQVTGWDYQSGLATSPYFWDGFDTVYGRRTVRSVDDYDGRYTVYVKDKAGNVHYCRNS